MKLISTFEKNDTIFVTDESGNTYKLVLVSKVIPQKKCDDPQLKNKIIDMLSNLQVPTNYSGYRILVDCLYFSITSEDYRTSFSKKLYPKVAELHGILPGSVPSALNILACNWRTSGYRVLFGKKCVAPKKLILTLTDYYFVKLKRSPKRAPFVFTINYINLTFL